MNYVLIEQYNTMHHEPARDEEFVITGVYGPGELSELDEIRKSLTDRVGDGYVYCVRKVLPVDSPRVGEYLKLAEGTVKIIGADEQVDDGRYTGANIFRIYDENEAHYVRISPGLTIDGKRVWKVADLDFGKPKTLADVLNIKN